MALKFSGLEFREASMQEYEIRVLRDGSVTSLIMKTMQFTDLEAIRVERRIAGDNLFEVWRDLECVHGSADDKPIPFPSIGSAITGCPPSLPVRINPGGALFARTDLRLRAGHLQQGFFQPLQVGGGKIARAEVEDAFGASDFQLDAALLRNHRLVMS